MKREKNIEFIAEETLGDSVSNSRLAVPKGVKVLASSPVNGSETERTLQDGTNDDGKKLESTQEDENFGAALSSKNFNFPLQGMGRRATYQAAINPAEGRRATLK